MIEVGGLLTTWAARREARLGRGAWDVTALPASMACAEGHGSSPGQRLHAERKEKKQQVMRGLVARTWKKEQAWGAPAGRESRPAGLGLRWACCCWAYCGLGCWLAVVGLVLGHFGPKFKAKKEWAFSPTDNKKKIKTR